MNSDPHSQETEPFDYIVVGSGAGGGPLAARLAQAGRRVLVIEAGSNHAEEPADAGAREVTLAPSLHGASTEHDDVSWQFFVEHYVDPPAGQDPKRHEPAGGEDDSRAGIFYPRAAGLGGCTVHNAMITIAGPASDWDDLADFLGDDSWRGNRMRYYFQRLERNEYFPRPSPTPSSRWGRAWDRFRWLFGFDPDRAAGRHGFDGWLHTSLTDISLGLSDKQIVKVLKGALKQSKRARLERSSTLVRRFLKGQIQRSLDPNHATTQAKSPEGLVLIPLAVCGDQTTIHQNRATPFSMRGRRSSPRELLLETRASHPQNLVIWSDCLVTKVLFEEKEGSTPRACGVEIRRGKRLYRAHPQHSADEGTKDEVRVRDGGEVILCGGAFNTPQLLMLSGIGDAAHLEEHHIDCRVHSPGVGRNLQDRYEVTIISEMKKDFSLLQGATFRLPDPPTHPDPHLRQWREEGTGLYTSNGAVLGIFKRSRPDLAQPDLFIFGLPLPFKGYEVGYSDVGDQHNFFTWAILKAQTSNHDGTVRLRTGDPRDTPLINFHYFNEVSKQGDSGNDPDLLAMVDGVKFVRGIAKHARPVIRGEYHPGLAEVPDDSDARIKDWVRRDAWGHHACGTCRMGPDSDEHAVLDSRFRVRGVGGLRVVDASIFPKIPGYFIVTEIYMASEKAADVIIEDAEQAPADSPEYPRQLRDKEAAAISLRRTKLTDAQSDAGTAGSASVGDGAAWAEDVTGLGLSGGGIRSATFNLGVLQSLAKTGQLRRIDFLSTVSGGGYIGSFLGRMFDQLRGKSPTGTAAEAARPAPDHVRQELSAPDSRAVEWLRKHGNYIAPMGAGDWPPNLATFLRNFLSVHFVVGLLLFAAFGVANAVRYGLFDKFLAVQGLVIDKGDLPIGHLVQALLGPFFSPWFVLSELLLLFLVLPRIVGYWVVSQDKHERFQMPTLVLLFVTASVLLYVSVCNGLALEPLFLALALFSAFIHVELAWCRGRKRERAIGSGGEETQRLRARNYLTYDLGLSLTLTGAALAFALLDTVAHGLQQWIVEENISYAKAFSAIGAAVAALIPVVRFLAGFFSRAGSSAGPPSTMQRILKEQVVAALLALVLSALPLILYAFAAHAVYQGGSALWIGIGATVLALLLSLILTHSKARVFVNRSSLAQTYAARLARAYLGASNPLRHRAQGANVTEVIDGDDVVSIQDYQPHAAGGPLHLINVTVNQTVDFTSQRGNRDRQGENMAVSCLGLSIGQRWHSGWGAPAAVGRHRVRLNPLGHVPGTTHPLIDVAGRPASQAEVLSLRRWMAISGAAVGPGRGQTTSLGTALLFGLANLRTGHWWDSGITQAARDGFPELTFTRRLLYLIPRVFRTQALIIAEWIARFSGPWERYWQLSDGGFFENMGGYELIRRRVPRIIICDGSSDPTYQFESFSDMVRKVRIDFDASIEPFEVTEDKDDYAAAGIPDEVRQYLGSLDELRPEKDASGNAIQPSKKHAALFWVRYHGGPDRKSVLLYLKASVTGDEAADIRQYQAARPEFPHESTGDQFFDEAQWESYRLLGEHLSRPLFANRDWFWAIPLENNPT